MNTRREFMKLSLAAAAGFGAVRTGNAKNSRTPNIVIIFLDDSGWGDFQPFGKHKYMTPNVECLAKEGCKYNNFYVPQAICSASRAALLSGCYPGRTKVFGAHGPGGRGLDPEYATMGEVFQDAGYRTAIFGKWHIGDQKDTRPWVRGFDESCGLLYSNDMWEFHPGNPKHWSKYPLQYWENDKVTIERVTKAHQTMLTTWYTEHAVDFIKKNKEKPFFLYVPHSMPHVPLFVSKKFEGKSKTGLYGDVMMELDWSVGQITKALKHNNLDDNTIVIFSSDNGPWISYGNHAGETPFREAKATSFDGGIRSACIIKYPHKIKAGTQSSKMFCTIDLLPTLACLTKAKLPNNTIDGKDVWDIIVNADNAKNPHKYYPFSTGRKLEGVISSDGKWKLHLPHRFRTLEVLGKDGMPGKYRQGRIKLSLFDMENDPYETKDVKEKYPEILAMLKGYAEKHQKKFFSKRKKQSRK